MSKDIVERLRTAQKQEDVFMDDLDEAADTIEQLQERVKELERQDQWQARRNSDLYDRLAAQAATIKALREAIEGAYDYVEEAIERRISEYGENFRPERLKYMRNVKAACDEALTIQDNSSEVLQQWLDGVMGEPVGYTRDGVLYPTPQDDVFVYEPLYRKPEIK